MTQFSSYFLAICSSIAYLGIGVLFFRFYFSRCFKHNYDLKNSKKVFTTLPKWCRIGSFALLLILVFYLDFARVYVFENLNFQMEYQYKVENGAENLSNYTDSFMERLLGETSSKSIFYLKFVAGIVFTFLYFFATTLLLFLGFGTKLIVYYTFVFYSISFGLMGFFYLFALYPIGFENQYNFYVIAMEISHLSQSSLPTLLFIVVMSVYKKMHVTTT